MVEIVSMTREHLDTLAELETLCFSVPWSRSMIESELYNELAEYYVALRDGCVVGYAGSQTVLDMTSIMNIAVLPGERRGGIASMLMGRILSRCAERNVVQVSLEVRESNAPAIALYERFGFSSVGRRRGYYVKPDEDALVMVLQLSGGAE